MGVGGCLRWLSEQPVFWLSCKKKMGRQHAGARTGVAGDYPADVTGIAIGVGRGRR